MDPLLKTVKNTLNFISDFINEVQDVGYIKNSKFAYDLAHNMDDVAVFVSYTNSVKKLFHALQSIMKQLQEPSLDFAVTLMAPNCSQGTRDERQNNAVYSDTSQASFSQSSFMPLHCSAQDNFKDNVHEAFDSCQSYEPVSHLQRDSVAEQPQQHHEESRRQQESRIHQLHHHSSQINQQIRQESQFNQQLNQESHQHQQGEQSQQHLQQQEQFRETLSLPDLCPPFHNLAINSTVDAIPVCEPSQNTQSISTDGMTTFPAQPHSLSSCIATMSSSTPCLSQPSLSNFKSSLTSMSEPRSSMKGGSTQGFQIGLRSCKKCNSVLVSDKVSGSLKDGCTSCIKQRDSPERRKRRASFSHPCLLCNRIFLTWKHFYVHMKKVHPKEETERQDSTTNAQLAEDDGSIQSLPLFCCKTCNSASGTFASFQTHTCRLPNEDGDELSNRILITDARKLQEIKKFVCDVCGVEFRSLKRILYHLPRCFPGPYPCNICSNFFVSLKDLNYHKKKNHRDEKCFTCDECGKEFLRRASLRKHCVNRHESKAFLEAMENKDVVSHRCDFCPKKFIRKIFLTNHKIRIHGLEKKFLCQVCGKKLMSNGSLQLHMDIHKEKKFECKYCDRRFRRKEKLMYHERIHTGERPFECTRCDKSFVSSSRLNEHLRRHEAEKRFECPKCDKSYASAWDLKKHVRKKHDLQVATQYIKVVLKKSDRFQEQVESSVPDIPNTPMVGLLIQGEPHTNAGGPFAGALQNHCLQRLEVGATGTGLPSLLSTPVTIQGVGESQLLYQTERNVSQRNHLEGYSNS